MSGWSSSTVRKSLAESEWSAWACADGTYYDTNEAFAKLAKAFGDRVVYTRYVAPIPPKDAWVDYFNVPQFLVPPDDPIYDLTDETAALAEGHQVVGPHHIRQMGTTADRRDRRSQNHGLRHHHRLLRAHHRARRGR